jgi:hypothetical protein
MFSGELKLRFLLEVLPLTMVPGFLLKKSESVNFREEKGWVGFKGSGFVSKIFGVDIWPSEPWVV